MNQYILDTDTLSLFQQGHPKVIQHLLAHPSPERAISVISVEEQLSGWYTSLRRTKKASKLAEIYLRLTQTVQSLARLQIISFSELAIRRFEELKRMKLNIGTMDLRIAAIVLEQRAVLVSRNLRDFQRVPGLVVEDWTK